MEAKFGIYQIIRFWHIYARVMADVSNYTTELVTDKQMHANLIFDQFLLKIKFDGLPAPLFSHFVANIIIWI